MLFQSFDYLFLFLPLTFLLYSVFARTSVANVVLFGASVFFYAYYDYRFTAFLFASAFGDYYLGRAIGRTKAPSRRKLLIAGSIVLNLGLLFVLKYSGWLSIEFNRLSAWLGLTVAITPLLLPLPAGISFYTFQTLSYTIDVYRRARPPHENLLDYLSFVTFFPHLVAGPIMRSTDLLPQLARRRSLVSSQVAASSMFLIAWGLTKKLVFADNFGDIVDHVDLSTPGAGIIFTYAFALQIYCDFSAYSDIAIGSAKLFNIDLRRNFLTPYLSTSPREFWQRWHISLSTWLRDYLYIPIGGSRGDAAEITRNLIVTMTLCGLWHGAGFLFALWGFYHGVLLALYRYVPYDKYLRAILGNAFGNALAIFLTFNLVCVGWALFRAHSLAELTALWTSTTALMTFQGSAWTAFLEYFWIFLMFMIPIFATEVIGYRFDCEFPDLRDRFPMWLTVTLYIGMFYAVVWFGKRASNAFIYFQF